MRREDVRLPPDLGAFVGHVTNVGSYASRGAAVREAVSILKEVHTGNAVILRGEDAALVRDFAASLGWPARLAVVAAVASCRQRPRVDQGPGAASG